MTLIGLNASDKPVPRTGRADGQMDCHKAAIRQKTKKATGLCPARRKTVFA